jgi:hypothetical protein
VVVAEMELEPWMTKLAGFTGSTRQTRPQHPPSLDLACVRICTNTAHARQLTTATHCDRHRPPTMFSGSNSYLGGGNSARPGQPPYGQQQSFQQPGGFQGGLGPQPTGFGGGQLQPQFTGFPGQPQSFQQAPQQQPQFTGYPGQQGQGFQQAPQQQPFQTGAPQQQQAPPQPQRPQPTGMTSAQMANSFRASPAASSIPPPPPAKSSKIPNIRLSFITAPDQAKFEQLFKSAVGNAQAMSGDQARDLLMRSKLTGDALSHIW